MKRTGTARDVRAGTSEESVDTESGQLAADSSRQDSAETAPSGNTAKRRAVSVNGRILQANWREQLPSKIAARDRMAEWAARYPVVGEIAGELRSGEVRKVFWRRPKAQAEGMWARRPSRERVRAVLLERRVLIAGVLAVAVFVAADGQFGGAVDERPLAPGEALHVAIAYPPQLLPNPQSVTPMLDAIAAGEKRREAHVVAAAARATLERAKAEAAAAASGEWQDWMGQRAPVVPGAMVPVPGSTPSVGGFSLPAKGAFTSGFGSRWGTMHRGIDIAGPIGSPIYAVADGTVVEAGPAQGFGLWVRIRHDDGTISIYGHMYDFFVSQGERVPAGMQIARIGNRGDSTGPHLHFEIVQNGQHVDPQAWLAMHGLRLD
ncbi:M23 family metallopeptidase [Nocardia sp. NPDC056952]|uniref:M23 family metallopeptidase n=1 Tax=Nocardia sp. NPDC056952 TaxID=3345979 RepID=UPI0036337D29